jgi:hypothetical protein
MGCIDDDVVVDVVDRLEPAVMAEAHVIRHDPGIVLLSPAT